MDAVSKARKELSDEIDAMMQKLGCEFYNSELLNKQNAELRKQVKQLLEDQQNMHDELERKNKQILGYIAITESVNQRCIQESKETQERFNFQANVVGMQYEVRRKC